MKRRVSMVAASMRTLVTVALALVVMLGVFNGPFAGTAHAQTAQTAQTAQPAVRAAPAPSPFSAAANRAGVEPVLGIGDVIKMSVYQNPDLAVEQRISEAGQINVPLIGAVTVTGKTVPQAQAEVERLLRDGKFVLRPQVTIQTLTIRSSQISILGQVPKPGRFPIDIVGSRVSEMIAAAGGVLPGGADIVTVVGNRNGKPVKLDIDLPLILQLGRADLDAEVENGDIIYVDRAPTIYIYGEVQRPGQVRLEREMTLLQALATAGGLTAKGTERGIRVNRKDEAGATKVLEMKMLEKLQRDDVVYVRESLF